MTDMAARTGGRIFSPLQEKEMKDVYGQVRVNSRINTSSLIFLRTFSATGVSGRSKCFLPGQVTPHAPVTPTTHRRNNLFTAFSLPFLISCSLAWILVWARRISSLSIAWLSSLMLKLLHR